MLTPSVAEPLLLEPVERSPLLLPNENSLPGDWIYLNCCCLHCQKMSTGYTAVANLWLRGRGASCRATQTLR